MGSNAGSDASSLVLMAFCCRTQFKARSEVTSSSQRYRSEFVSEGEAEGAVFCATTGEPQEQSITPAQKNRQDEFWAKIRMRNSMPKLPPKGSAGHERI